MELVAWFAAGAVVATIVAVVVSRARRAVDTAQSRRLPGARELVRAMPQAAVLIDAHGYVLVANQRASEFGVKLSTGYVIEEVRELGVRAQARDAAITAEIQRRGRQSSEGGPLTASATKVGEHGATLIVFDVAEAGSIARLAHREFVVNVSHELKTPVGALALLADAITAAAEDGDQVRRFASRISTEWERLALLVDQVINLSRAQASDSVHDGTI